MNGRLSESHDFEAQNLECSLRRTCYCITVIMTVLSNALGNYQEVRVGDGGKGT